MMFHGYFPEGFRRTVGEQFETNRTLILIELEESRGGKSRALASLTSLGRSLMKKYFLL